MTSLTRTEAIVAASLQELISDRYGSQAEAANAWGMDPSMLCRILSGERAASNWVPKIAGVENLPEDWFYQPRLRVHSRSGLTSSRFQFDVSEPVRMLLQLEDYFSDLPERCGPKVAKAVMRTLLDEFFGEVHRPSEEWRLVMNRLEHFAPVRNTRRRSVEKT